MKNADGRHLVNELIAATGLKHRELAEKLGLKANTVACWACGARKPSGTAIRLMQRLLSDLVAKVG